MTLWICYWKNGKRPYGMSTVTAATEDEARAECIRRIETKYWWQGDCHITECKPAKPSTEGMAL